MSKDACTEQAADFLTAHQEWLMDRLAGYACERGFARDTSNLREAWRASLQGLTAAIAEALASGRDMELGPDEDYTDDPACRFGMVEAQRHRARGVGLAMFLGLFKYYRQSYRELVTEMYPQDDRQELHRMIRRVFDRIEIAFCSEWGRCDADQQIAELAAANRDLANEKNKFLTIFDHQGPALLILDESGRPLHVNLAAQKLLDLGEKPGGHYYGEQDLACELDWLEPAIDSFLTSDDDERTVEIEHGQERFETRLRRLRDIGRKFVGVALSLTPVTASHRMVAETQALYEQLQATQTQLVQSEKLAAVGQLAAGIAHEINNPLGYVTANLNQLREYQASLLTMFQEFASCLPDSESDTCRHLRERIDELDIEYILGDIPELMDETNDGLVRVIKIVADLKGFSRQDDGKLEAVDLHDLIESTINVVWNQLKYHVTLTREFGEVPPVYCLGNQLSQVVMNLLVNAGHAIEDKGEVTVRTGTTGDDVWIEVADTGCGIPSDQLTQIFEPFYTTKPAGTGTGLGLSVSSGIVEKHGGRLTVDSTVGQGTTFRITIPIAGPSGRPSRSPAGETVIA